MIMTQEQELRQAITEKDIEVIELNQKLTEMDLRLLEVEQRTGGVIGA